MNRWMVGLVDKLEEVVDGWLERLVKGLIDGWMNGWVDGEMSGRMDGLMDGFVDVEQILKMNRPTDGQKIL